MELNSNHEGVVPDLDNLHQAALGVGSANNQASRFQI
jgi:hypothetical protein